MFIINITIALQIDDLCYYCVIIITIIVVSLSLRVCFALFNNICKYDASDMT